MALPLLFMAGAAALQGVSTIAGGYMQGRANAAQALGAKIEGEMALLRGKQIKERSREDLATALGNIDAIRAGRGMSVDSPTGQLIERRTRRDAYRDEAVAVLSELHRAGAAEQQRRGYATAARWALPLAVLNSAGSFAQAFSYGTMGGGK